MTTKASSTNMTNNTEKTAEANIPKLGMLEEDDEFEEFPVEGTDKRITGLLNHLPDWDESYENKLDVEQWEVDWDDDNLDDEFSIQLRNELQKVAAQNAMAPSK